MASGPQTDWEFVFDTVVGFLTSPIWNLPINNFIETNCVLFTRETSLGSFKGIHQSYKTMIESLLASFLKDVGITEELFVMSCQMASSHSEPLMQMLLEQVVAADNIELFHQIMLAKNLELELQTISILEKDVRPRTNPERPVSLPKDELEIMQVLMKNGELNALDPTEALPPPQLEDHLEKLEEKVSEQQKQVQTILGKALKEIETDPIPIGPKNLSLQDQPVRSGNLNAIQPSRRDPESLSGIEDLKTRAEYLKAQRERLLALKKKEREHRLDTAVRVNPGRPTTANAARQAMSQTSPTGRDPIPNQSPNRSAPCKPENTIRRALVEKLKEVVNRET